MHLLPSLWMWVSEWNMASSPEPKMHREHHVSALSLVLLRPPSLAPANQLTPGRQGAPRRTTAVPLSILELQSVDEKTEVCSDYSWGCSLALCWRCKAGRKRRRWGTTWVQTLALLTVWGCWGQQCYIIKTTVTPQTEEELPTAFSAVFSKTCSSVSCSPQLILNYDL